MSKKTIAAVLAAAATALAAYAPAASAQVEIKFPLKVNATTLRGELTQAFADELAKESKGKYKVTIYPGGQLYSGDKAVKAVQLGNVQMTNEPNSAYTSYTKNADLMEMPFGFADAEAFQDFLHGPRADIVRKDLDKAGFTTLAFFDEGPFVIATKEKLIKAPADFKGQIIRTSGHPVVVDGLKGMGASTVKIPLNEVYSALQQGTITGVYTTFDAYIDEKMYEVAPNVMIIPSYGAYFWTANKAWFDALPEADRKLMIAIASKLAKKYDKDVWAASSAHVAAVNKAGGKISDPAKDPAARKVFREAMAKTYDKLREKFGKEPVDAILAAK
jgi:TRAP-type C4-dicarboxylate transport system substrate-binding protein